MNTAPFSRAIEQSSCLDEAISRFLNDIKAWVYDCIETYSAEPPTDVHDQLTYTTGWEPYLVATKDQQVLDFLSRARNTVAGHFVDSDQWYHGYWRMQEAHHGTEHFELFLGMMSRINPEDGKTIEQLVDAVEHIGNWSPDVPEWYDASTGLFRSLYFGTDGIREDLHQLNMPDHLRCANLLVLVFEATKETKYLDLADAYAGRWAEAINDTDLQLPLGITRDGVLTELSGDGESVYRGFAGMAGDLQSDLDRAENILASGGIQLFLKLWTYTQTDGFLTAAQRLLTILSGELSDPDAGAVADAIRSYRRTTGLTDFDSLILNAVEPLDPNGFTSLEISLPPTLDRRPGGIGKRADMPFWLEGESARRVSPILLSVAAEIRKDDTLAMRAVDLGRVYFSLAREHLRDGRHHGCAARTISAIARGHGRDNHAGVTTGILLPLLPR